MAVTNKRTAPACAMAPEAVRETLDILADLHPDAHCELNHTTDFELLVATILSAQSTDVRVNMVTERLFAKYNTPEDFAALTPERVAEEIKELGLYRNKARSLVNMSRQLLELHDGQVPADRKALEALAGVGRKTANVVLSNAFDVPAIAVDTHVFRVAQRIGLAEGTTPLAIERQLMECVPEDEWTMTHHRLIFHGRRVCEARQPKCGECPLAHLCRFVQAPENKDAAER